MKGCLTSKRTFDRNWGLSHDLLDIDTMMTILFIVHVRND